jgi:hypothetical protein
VFGGVKSFSFVENVELVEVGHRCEALQLVATNITTGASELFKRLLEAARRSVSGWAN